MSITDLLDPIPLGIAAGLFLGNPIGIMTVSWLAVKLGIASLPRDVNWSMLFGASILCGIGFTMSLFIGSLAFEHSGIDQTTHDRLGILTGSLFAAMIGYIYLRLTLPRRQAKTAAD
jgi:NhaA family Na+:H+ antiporter